MNDTPARLLALVLLLGALGCASAPGPGDTPVPVVMEPEPELAYPEPQPEPPTAPEAALDLTPDQFRARVAEEVGSAKRLLNSDRALALYDSLSADARLWRRWDAYLDVGTLGLGLTATAFGWEISKSIAVVAGPVLSRLIAVRLADKHREARVRACYEAVAEGEELIEAFRRDWTELIDMADATVASVPDDWIRQFWAADEEMDRRINGLMRRCRLGPEPSAEE